MKSSAFLRAKTVTAHLPRLPYAMAIAATLAAALLAFPSAAEVPAAASDQDWSSMSGALRGTNWDIYSMVSDPAGNLFVSGKILAGDLRAGDRMCSGIARWDGREWSALGQGFAGSSVSELAFHNGELYAAGSFYEAGGIKAENFAKWDGSRWSTPGTGPVGSILAMASYQGSLYVAGSFSTAGGITVNNLTRWDGTRWSAVGPGANGSISALTIHNGEMYVGGSFTTIGGVAANRLAKWNGTQWSAIGSGTNGSVTSIAGLGSALYVAGSFSTAGGVAALNIAKWDGSRWSSPGPPTVYSGAIESLAVFGGELFVGGHSVTFNLPTGFQYFNVLKWSGSQWFALEDNLGKGTNGRVNSLVVAGDSLYAGGSFTEAGGNQVNNIARWSGGQWFPLTAAQVLPTNGPVETLLSWNGDLYAGGNFSTIGGASANHIAKWNGRQWSALGDGVAWSGQSPQVSALAVYRGELHAAGYFRDAGGMVVNHVARWDGTQWYPLGAGTNGHVRALAVFGGELYAGGTFTSAGGAAASRIAKWDGTRWSGVGTVSLSASSGARVHALMVHDGALYVGGHFTKIGSTNCGSIVRWNGSVWQTLSQAPGGTVNSMAVSNGELHAGGNAGTFMKWDGARWLTLESTQGGEIYGMAAMPGGICAGGSLGTPFNNIAKWNGAALHTLGSGIRGGSVKTMIFHDGALFVGGDFVSAGGKYTPRIARLDQRLPPVHSGLSITAVPKPLGGARVTLQFEVIQGYDHAVEVSPNLAAGAIWQPLPGAPHQTGTVIEDSTAPRRFYRLRRTAQP